MKNKSKVTKNFNFRTMFWAQNGGNIYSRNNSEAENSNDVIVGMIDNATQNQKRKHVRKRKKVTEKNVVVKKTK